MLIALLVPIGLAILVYLTALIRAALASGAQPNLEALALGAVVNFFDTFGIGSFAPTTAWLKFRKLVPDRLIPPTMVVGLTPPAMVESIVFLILLGVRVDPVLLFGCAIATMVGGIVGAPLVVEGTGVGRSPNGRGRAAACGRRLRDDQSAPISGRRKRSEPSAANDGDLHRSELRLRYPRQFRGWQLRADPGDAEPDGHGPAAVLPDHGGRRIVDGRWGQRPPHRDRPSRHPDCPRPRDRRNSGGACRSASREIDAARHSSMAGIVVVLYAAAVMARAAYKGRREAERTAHDVGVVLS